MEKETLQKKDVTKKQLNQKNKYLKNKFANWIDNLRNRYAWGETNEANYKDAPNVLAHPFMHQQWKIVGKIFDFQNSTIGLKKQNRPARELLYRFAHKMGGVFGLVILVLVIVLGLVIPLFTVDPNHQDVSNRFLAPNEYDSHNAYHVFGTDDLGRDYWSRLWWGLRYSIGLALSVTVVEVVVGLAAGIAMGYFHVFDIIMTFIIKVLTTVPTILILILMAIVISPSFGVIVFSLSITSWTGLANQVRAQVKRARNAEWVLASRVLGTPMYKILKNFLPVVFPILITQLIFTIPGVILSETSLAFIGLTIDYTPTLGNLISAGQQLFPSFLRYAFIPSFFLVLITISVQLIGDGFQDALRKQR